MTACSFEGRGSVHEQQKILPHAFVGREIVTAHLSIFNHKLMFVPFLYGFNK